MPPNDNNKPVEPVLPVNPEMVDMPGPSLTSSEPAPTIPPLETLQNHQPQAAAPVVAPAPLPQTPPSQQPPTQTSMIAATPKKGSPLKVLVILIALLALLGIGAFVVKTLLPQLQGGGAAETKLTWWGLWEEESVVQPLIEEYQLKNPNVKISFVKQSPEDYRERLTSAIAQKSGPDIFRFHNSWLPMFNSVLEPLPASVMSASQFAQTYYPSAVSDLTSGTGIMGIPLEFDSIGLYINEEIFETYLRQPPTTWDELRQLAKDLTIKDETGAIRQSGIAMGRTENVDHWPEILALLMMQNNVDMRVPTGPLAQDALDFFTRFSRIDGIWNESLPPSTSAFAGGKLAMYFGPSWRAHEIARMNPNLRFKVVPMPQLPKESADEPSMYYSTYWVEGVWSESKAKVAAWDFLKFMSEKETLQKFYQNSASVDPNRKFGEPYPRMDMASLLDNDFVASAFVRQGKEAKSWYLASRTYDGPTGINSLLVKYFADAVNSVIAGNSPEAALKTAAAGVAQVLAQYGLAVQ